MGRLQTSLGSEEIEVAHYNLKEHCVARGVGIEATAGDAVLSDSSRRTPHQPNGLLSEHREW